MSDWKEMLEEAKSLFDDDLIDEEEYKRMKEQALELREKEAIQASSASEQKLDKPEESQRYQESYSSQVVQSKTSSTIPVLVWVILGLGGFMVVFLGLVILFWPATEAQTITQDTYEITCADGWKFADNSTYQYKDLRCEPDGMLSSALFILQVYDDTSLPLEEMHKIFLDGFIPAFKQMVSGFEIDNGQYANYGDFSGFQSTYSASVLGVKSDGMLLTFQGCGKTFVVMNQSARDDKSKYAGDFNFMESRVKCTGRHEYK